MPIRKSLGRSAAAEWLTRKTGIRNPVLAARRIGEELLQATVGDVGAPVPIEQVAERLGIAVVRAPISRNGLLVPTPNGYVAKIRISLREPYFRFSLAHEIAHTVFAGPEGLSGGTAGLVAGDKTEENLCDEIADALLMPERRFRERIQPINGRKMTCGGVLNLAKEFVVPAYAVARRIAGMRGDYVFVIWRYRARESGGPNKLRVDWWAAPGGIFVPWNRSNHARGNLITKVYRSGGSISGYETYFLGSLKGDYYTHAVRIGSEFEGEACVFSVICLADSLELLRTMERARDREADP